MAIRMQWLCGTRLRDKIANYGHAMPIGLACLNGGIRVNSTPIFVFAHARSVPISWGSPPTSG